MPVVTTSLLGRRLSVEEAKSRLTQLGIILIITIAFFLANKPHFSNKDGKPDIAIEGASDPVMLGFVGLYASALGLKLIGGQGSPS